ncbi:DUF5324 family protein [Streptomyces durbertensis]|uniref:DUF5324 family protein n=1 Tax=Streptomyces durbertensis TaxID=2448886 RepID=A0ABR6EKG7_9ACTN|nr:DUF5324 family protein [Streptomyces durbertensis]MBB1245638.1 DUF5324 family protein [Streptomyces durbertensis]
MTRIDDVRARTKGSAKEGMRHARAVKDTVAPKVGHAAKAAGYGALEQYHSRLAPRLAHARETLPPTLDDAATKAALRTREAARHAADYAGPRLEAARAAAGPAKEEAMARSGAALAALRGEVTAADVRKITKRRARRARTGRVFRRLAVLGLLTGAAVAAWRWWDRQANPEWLVEPPEATEVGEEMRVNATPLDPEVEAKEAADRKAEEPGGENR